MAPARNAHTCGSRSMITGHAGIGAARSRARMRRAGWRYRRRGALARGRRLPRCRAGSLARAPRRAGQRAALALRAARVRTVGRASGWRLARDRLRLRGAGGGDPRAHYLHTVLERGAGVPIACSAIWIAVGAARRDSRGGVNLPGHFVVRVDGHLFDTIASGEPLDEDDVNRLVTTSTGHEVERLEPAQIARASARDMLAGCRATCAAATRASNAGTRRFAPPTGVSTS